MLPSPKKPHYNDAEMKRARFETERKKKIFETNPQIIFQSVRKEEPNQKHLIKLKVTKSGEMETLQEEKPDGNNIMPKIANPTYIKPTNQKQMKKELHNQQQSPKKNSKLQLQEGVQQLNQGIQGMNINSLKRRQSISQQVDLVGKLKNSPQAQTDKLIIKAIEGNLDFTDQETRDYLQLLKNNKSKSNSKVSLLNMQFDQEQAHDANQLITQNVAMPKIGQGKVIIVNKSGQAYIKNPNPNASPQWTQISNQELMAHLYGNQTQVNITSMHGTKHNAAAMAEQMIANNITTQRLSPLGQQETRIITGQMQIPDVSIPQQCITQRNPQQNSTHKSVTSKISNTVRPNKTDSNVSLSTKPATSTTLNSNRKDKTKDKEPASPTKGAKANKKQRVHIYHKGVNPHKQHKINKAITTINNVIKLIFKNSKDSLALTTSNATTSLMGSSRQLEDNRLQEISKIARQMNISIPKKFDSKASLREYVTSREFILTMKIKMNNMLHKAILQSIGIPMNVIEANMYGQTGQIQPKPGTESAAWQDSSKVYQSKKFYVGVGNNSAIVKSVLKQRYWWQYGSEESFNADCDFIWTSWKKAKHIDFLQRINDKQKNFASEHINLEMKRQEDMIEDPSLGQGKPLEAQQALINKMVLPLKLYNRLDGNKQLTNKKGVFVNMRKYYEAIGEDPFSVLPLTFHTTRGQQDPAYIAFVKEYNDIEMNVKKNDQKIKQAVKKHREELKVKKLRRKEKKKQQGGSDYEETSDIDSDEEDMIQQIKRKYRTPQNTWIIKPGENTNRGRGITVVKTLRDVNQIIKTKSKNERTYIIQKYIDYPLLVHKRKFDFRCFGILSSINGSLKGYCYNDGYVRTSSREYTLDDVTDPYIHLTNDAIQEKCEEYGKFENGNKMSFQDFNKVINAQQPDLDFDFFRDIFPQIEKLMADTYKAAQLKIDPGRLQNSFELFGYDFMIDEDFRLYLIEVNTNPCLEVSCPLMARIIPEVLDNCFKIVLDPLYPSPDLSHNRKFQLNELPQEIKFNLVYDEDLEGEEVIEKLTRTVKGSIEEADVEEEIESDLEKELAEDDGDPDAY